MMLRLSRVARSTFFIVSTISSRRASILRLVKAATMEEAAAGEIIFLKHFGRDGVEVSAPNAACKFSGEASGRAVSPEILTYVASGHCRDKIRRRRLLKDAAVMLATARVGATETHVPMG